MLFGSDRLVTINAKNWHDVAFDQLIINFTCHGCTVQPNQNTSDIDDDLLPSFNRDDVHDLSSDHEEMDQSADLILPLQKNRGETTH
jgi:hypothetical protein